MSTEAGNSVVEALKTFSEKLQCVVCFKLPKETRICPYCSVLFCRACIWQWLTRPFDPELDEAPDNMSCCPHCRRTLQVDRLIQFRCFDRIEDLGPTLENVLDRDTNICESGGNNSGISEEDISKPEYKLGQFTLKRFAPKRGPMKILSQEIVDDLGSVWKLEVWPKGYQVTNHWISVYLLLAKGLEGRYQFTIELLNEAPVKINFPDNYFKIRESMGIAKFVDTRSLQNSRADLRFRFMVRPISFEEKSKLQKKLIQKFDEQDNCFKGLPDMYTYRIDEFSEFNKKQKEIFHHELSGDCLNNTWRYGICTGRKNRCLEFKLHLVDGFSGLYHVHLELTHDEPECSKNLSYQHDFVRNSSAVFNMQIRWNQLEEFGYTHFENDFLEVRVTIEPLQINLKDLPNQLEASQNTYSEDWDGKSDDTSEYYF